VQGRRLPRPQVDSGSTVAARLSFLGRRSVARRRRTANAAFRARIRPIYIYARGGTCAEHLGGAPRGRAAASYLPLFFLPRATLGATPSRRHPSADPRRGEPRSWPSRVLIAAKARPVAGWTFPARTNRGVRCLGTAGIMEYMAFND
jgi:hypothetical protein